MQSTVTRTARAFQRELPPGGTSVRKYVDEPSGTITLRNVEVRHKPGSAEEAEPSIWMALPLRTRTVGGTLSRVAAM